jgi:hypothetical protein
MTMSRSRFVSLLAALAMTVAVAASAASATPTVDAPAAACATSAATAARTFVHTDASVTGYSRIAGLPTAAALDGRITPGFSTALLKVGGRWCSVEAFNAAAREHLAGADAKTIASAFASVAAMPYLGRVAVSNVSAAGPAVRLTTTGGRHGAQSQWTVIVDGTGVQSATFTTTGWLPGAADGSIGGYEGVTSLPGHTRTFARGADGLVRIDATVDTLLARAAAEREAAVANAAKVAGLAPGDDLAHTFADGYTIKVSYGMAPYTPDAGMDTGVKHADRLRRILSGVKVSYNDFLRWGISDPFDNASRTMLGQKTTVPDTAGYINVDSPMSPVCLACAYLTDGIEIHILLLFPEVAPAAAGVNYPDSEQFLNGVLGHEMVHSLQGGYSNGAGGVFGDAFTEGSARASESLHDDASHTFQTGSIAYSDSGNGCEGFENGRGTWVAAQAAGPFNGHTYDACYFWWTYFAQHGATGLASLLKAMPAALAGGSGDSAARILRLLDVASPEGDGSADLARWGAAVATGSSADGFTIPAGQTGKSFDWYALLKTAQRASTLAHTQSVTVANGGVRAYRVAEAATIATLPAARTYVVDVVNRKFELTPAAVGTALTPGQIVVVVAGAGSKTGTLEAH